MGNRRDVYEMIPDDMRNYLLHYGWHFSKKMAEWAISMMRDRNGEKVKMKDKDSLKEMFKAHNINTDNMVGYDAVYVEAMARADFFGSSLATDAQVAKFVGDYINDKDGYEGMPFTRFYVDCVGKGKPIFWDEVL